MIIIYAILTIYGMYYVIKTEKMNYDQWKQEVPKEDKLDAQEEDTQCEICGELNFETDIASIEIEGGELEEDCICKMCPDCKLAWENHAGIPLSKFKRNWNLCNKVIKNLCKNMQIKSGTKEYNEIMKRNITLNRK